MKQILLVEDDVAIVDNLSIFLQKEGFMVTAKEGQKEALDWLELHPCDLVLLDVSLAQGNGFSTCNAIKDKWNLAVIFLTASGDEYSVVTGLDMGADDYISKPFRPRELVSRINSVLRRYESNAAKDNEVMIQGLLINTDKALVKREEQEISLSALEYRLLLIFVKNRGQVLSRAILLEKIWDVSMEFVNDNTLTVYIKRLREKIEEDPANPKIIKTVRGLGYRME